MILLLMAMFAPRQQRWFMLIILDVNQSNELLICSRPCLSQLIKSMHILPQQSKNRSPNLGTTKTSKNRENIESCSKEKKRGSGLLICNTYRLNLIAENSGSFAESYWSFLGREGKTNYEQKFFGHSSASDYITKWNHCLIKIPTKQIFLHFCDSKITFRRIFIYLWLYP